MITEQPPQDLRAERSVLGGVLLSTVALTEVAELLAVDDFYAPAHQVIYTAALQLRADGQPVDPVTVAADLERTGVLAKVGGAPYLHTLIAEVPTATNAIYYADIVADKAVLRRLAEAGTRIVDLGYHTPAGADATVEHARAELDKLVVRRGRHL